MEEQALKRQSKRAIKIERVSQGQDQNAPEPVEERRCSAALSINVSFTLDYERRLK